LDDLLFQFWEQVKAIPHIEWLGVITGALCVYLAAKENILNWPISILSIACYIYIFYGAKLYGDTILQFYFLFTAIYGWYYWSYGKTKSLKSERPITRVKRNEWVFIFLIILIIGLLAGYLLDTYTDTDVPYIDGFCTITSFVAQFLMTRKKLENWLIWIFVDIVYIPLYIHKDLLATAVLYFVFTFIALLGYRDWRQSFSLRR
jgi:nicotinamide mononucleotide transporter